YVPLVMPEAFFTKPVHQCLDQPASDTPPAIGFFNKNVRQKAASLLLEHFGQQINDNAQNITDKPAIFLSHKHLRMAVIEPIPQAARIQAGSLRCGSRIDLIKFPVVSHQLFPQLTDSHHIAGNCWSNHIFIQSISVNSVAPSARQKACSTGWRCGTRAIKWVICWSANHWRSGISR